MNPTYPTFCLSLNPIRYEFPRSRCTRGVELGTSIVSIPGLSGVGLHGHSLAHPPRKAPQPFHVGDWNEIGTLSQSWRRLDYILKRQLWTERNTSLEEGCSLVNIYLDHNKFNGHHYGSFFLQGIDSRYRWNWHILGHRKPAQE